MIQEKSILYRNGNRCRSWLDLIFQACTTISLLYLVIKVSILAMQANTVFDAYNSMIKVENSSSFVKKTFHGFPSNRPLIIAHRGSSGMRPEHTVAAYQLAVDQGADIIECDLAVTKDLKLVCSHDAYLNDTTDIHHHSVFKNRVTTYTIGGKTITDYFINDFTLAELKTLRRVQNRPYRDQSYNGLFQIATFDEYVAVAKFATTGDRVVGIYPETKNPVFFNQFLAINNTTMEDLLLASLHKHGYTSADSPCFVQSFDEQSLLYMANHTKLPLIYLTSTRPSSEHLNQLSTFCYGVGVSKNIIVQVDPTTNKIVTNTNFLKTAHAKKLKVHAFTFRNEHQFLAWDYGCDSYREYARFTELELDGFFTDYPWSLANFQQGN